MGVAGVLVAVARVVVAEPTVRHAVTVQSLRAAANRRWPVFAIF